MQPHQMPRHIGASRALNSRVNSAIYMRKYERFLRKRQKRVFSAVQYGQWRGLVQSNKKFGYGLIFGYRARQQKVRVGLY